MSTNQTVIISANPKSGSFSRHGLVLELKHEVESLGFQCEVHTDLDQMANRCHELIQTTELRTVVAAGGDGTASKVASLIPHGVPLTLFPTGSENLLAKYYFITADPAACARSIRRCRCCWTVVARCDAIQLTSLQKKKKRIHDSFRFV